MKPEELRKLFKDKCKPCYMFPNDPDSLMTGMYETDNLLEITVCMKNKHKIQIMYGEREEYIDITHNDEERYIGLGSTLISPMKDIESIDIKWRNDYKV